jgi:hypothetical protein
MITPMLGVRPERRPTAAAALGGPSGTEPSPALKRRRRKRRLFLAAIAACLVVAAASWAVAAGWAAAPWRHQAGRRKAGVASAAGAPTAGAPATAPCQPLPYQPCGQPAAPFTDGRACLPGHGDFDGLAADGCEAASDYVAGTELTPQDPVHANLVPADAVDVFSAGVESGRLHLCVTPLRVTLTAPAGVVDRVEILSAGGVAAGAVSRDRQPATASTSRLSCFRDQGSSFTVRVTAVHGQTAADFRLVRSGSR